MHKKLIREIGQSICIMLCVLKILLCAYAQTVQAEMNTALDKLIKLTSEVGVQNQASLPSLRNELQSINQTKQKYC